MAKIMTDTSTLYSIEQGEELGIKVVPLTVTINGKSYKEFEEISSEEFLGIIAQGHLPTSSQPAIGEVIDAYQSFGDEEVINITMADGLSGTYQSALAAADQLPDKGNITIVNSRTLCGPHRFMVTQANAMAKAGARASEVMEVLQKLIESAKSFLIPDDFDYLKRGGRLSPLAANMMGLLKAKPILVQSADGKKLDAHGVHRKEQALCKDMVSSLTKHGVGKGWLISVSHANNLKRATTIREAIESAFPSAETETLDLSPAFITQGGPRCVAIQAIEMAPGANA